MEILDKQKWNLKTPTDIRYAYNKWNPDISAQHPWKGVKRPEKVDLLGQIADFSKAERVIKSVLIEVRRFGDTNS